MTEQFFETDFGLQSNDSDPISTKRDLQQRGLDIINVKDARGGSDIERIVSAVNYALGTGGRARTVYFPSGRYVIEDGSQIPEISGKNIEIRGDGPSTILLVNKVSGSADTYGTVFLLTGSQLRVRDLTIEYDVTRHRGQRAATA